MTDPGLPSVSAIIATRGRPTLGRAIEGVLGQRYDGQVTCIVVFDGVDPIDLSDMPAGERRSLVAVSNGRTPGLAGARENTGADVATTELLAFCDDDDVWWPEKLRAQVELTLREASSVRVRRTSTPNTMTPVTKKNQFAATSDSAMTSNAADEYNGCRIKR